MKFNNTGWSQIEGCEVFAPQQAYEVDITDAEVWIMAPTQKIRGASDTLGLVCLTLRITTPMEEVIRVETMHYRGVKKKKPEFELMLSKPGSLTAYEDDQSVVVTSGSLKLVITKADWSMTYYRGNEKLTGSRGTNLCYVKTDWRGLAYSSRGDDAYMRQQLDIGVDEHVYGLGERFTAYVKNGQTVDMWNEDAGTNTAQTYKNIPFYLTDYGYGVFVNHPEKVSFEVGSEIVSKVGFSVPGESLDYFVINGPSMKEVLMRYTDMTGKPALPAAWTFGLWLSTSFTTDYDEKTVLSFIDGMKERDIPLRVFHFDCCWMREFHWTDFMWDSKIFPDPVGMLKKIHDRDIKVCVWINPYIAQQSTLFEEGMENGYFLKRENGDVWQWDMWQPGMALVDFTNPQACAWYKSKLAALLDMGVDCCKTDFGERIPVDAVYHNGADPVKMHNFYSYLYNKTVFEILEEKKGNGEAVLFARSATAGGQKFPVHWGGDCWSTYSGMAESLRGGLSLAMSGFGFWSHDIGGFESTSTPDVYKRWAAFGLLSSHSRLHGSISYRVPWSYDEEAVDVVRFFTKLKASLMPYIYRNAVEASKTGIPVMRSMVLEYTEEKNCAYLDKQYMFGDSLLTAPVFCEEGIAGYYLPEGSWTDFLSGEKKAGGKWYKEPCDYLNIPLFAAENSIIAVGARSDRPDYDFADHVELRIYELSDLAETQVYSPGAELELEAVAKRGDGKIEIHVKTEKPYSVRLVNVSAASVKGGRMEAAGTDTIIKADGAGTLVVCL